jgi:hypothetical protein
MQGCFCRKRERCGFYLLAFDHRKTMIERNKLIQLLLEEIKYFLHDNQARMIVIFKYFGKVVGPAGLEPATCRL